jgi:DNA-binding transcriptional regulator YiaG
MTASEVAAARLELGLSIPDCAEELGVPESRVADGESGKARIPRFGARALSYLVAMNGGTGRSRRPGSRSVGG